MRNQTLRELIQRLALINIAQTDIPLSDTTTMMAGSDPSRKSTARTESLNNFPLERWQSHWQVGDAGKCQEAKWESVTYEDLKVTVFGDTAIATRTFKGKGTESGKPLDEHERFTDTWVKMPNGQWQCVASQGSLIKQ